MLKEKMILASALAMAAVFAVAPPASAAQDAPGMVVVRDPQTGELRAPTAAELRALRAQDPTTAQMARPRPQSTVRPNGVRALNLGDRGMVYSVMQRGADGKLAMQCVKGEKAAADAIGQPAPAKHDKEHNHAHQ